MFNLIAVFFVCSGIGIAVHIAYDLTSHKPVSYTHLTLPTILLV